MNANIINLKTFKAFGVKKKKKSRPFEMSLNLKSMIYLIYENKNQNINSNTLQMKSMIWQLPVKEMTVNKAFKHESRGEMSLFTQMPVFLHTDLLFLVKTISLPDSTKWFPQNITMKVIIAFHLSSSLQNTHCRLPPPLITWGTGETLHIHNWNKVK